MNIMLTVAEAAELAHMSQGAVRRLCAEGQIKHIRIGSKRLINQSVFEDFLQGTVEPQYTDEAKSGVVRRIN